MSYINICNLFASAIHHITFSPVCRLREFCLWRWNTTFLETETKEVGRSTWYNTHNIRSLIRTPQVCPRHRCKRKKPLWNTHKHKHTYTHAHTHAHKHTHTHTHIHTQQTLVIVGLLVLNLALYWNNTNLTVPMGHDNYGRI